jgi:hypothetical protein
MADKNVELYYMHRPVLDLAALKAIDTTNTVGGMLTDVTHEGPFLFHDTSTDADDGINVIQPTVGPGRFIRAGMYKLILDGDRKIDISNLVTPIALQYGGTGANLTASNGGIFYSTGSAAAILSGTATAGQVLRSGTSGAPSWSTAVFPATTTINQILYSNTNNNVTGINTANSSILISNSSGVPAFSTAIPTLTSPVVTLDATQSTSVTTGSFITAGGLGVAKDAYFGGLGSFAGRLSCTYITLPNAPSASTDGANKAYVDGIVGANYWNLQTNTLVPKTDTWNISTLGRVTMANGTVTADPTTATDIANKKYVDQIVTGFWELIDTDLYPIDHTYNIKTLGRISATQGTLLSEPTLPTDMATKFYVDTRSPGTSLWYFNPGTGSIYPNEPEWSVTVGASLVVGELENNITFTPVLSPLGEGYYAQGVIHNGLYNPTGDIYTFRANEDGHAVGNVDVNSAGNLYTYAYNTESAIDVSISADHLYNDYIPLPNTTFYITYNSSINANFGAGTLTGIAVGGAAIANEMLDLAHNDIRWVSYDATNNITFTQTGAIRFQIVPNYEYKPPEEYGYFYCFFSIFTASPLRNAIYITHDAQGDLHVIMVDNAGNYIMQQNLGGWHPHLRQLYEFELNIDLNAGVSRLFIDGHKFGPDMIGTGTRTQVNSLFIGSLVTAQDILESNFYIRNFVAFSQVMHTANYTPGYTLQTSYKKLEYQIYPDRYVFHAATLNSNVLVGDTISGIATASLSTQVTSPDGISYPASALILNGYYDNLTSSYIFKTDFFGVARGYVTLFSNGKKYEYSYSSSSIANYNSVFAKDLYAGFQVPDGCTFFCSYDSSIDANYYLNSPAGVSYGDASVVNGRLDLAHNDYRNVSYAAYLNADFLTQGTIKFSLFPNWTTTVVPEDPQCYFYSYDNSEMTIPGRSGLAFYSVKNGSFSEFFLDVFDWAGNKKLHLSFGNWDASQARFYDVELNIDMVNNAHRLFIDGEQQGTTETGTCTRTSPGIAYVGNYAYPFPIPGLTFYASYDTSLNADFSIGDNFGTPHDGAAISSGFLDLAHDDNRYVSYSAIDNANFTQLGTIIFELYPNYTDAPETTDFSIFGISKDYSSDENYIELRHQQSDGHLYLFVYGSDSNPIINSADLGAWNPTPATRYIFKLEIDIYAGATKLFINNVQQGSTLVETGTRTDTAEILVIGKNTDLAPYHADAKYKNFHIMNQILSAPTPYRNNFYLKDLQVYNKVLHTADYGTSESPQLHSNLITQYDTNTNTYLFNASIGGSVDGNAHPSGTDQSDAFPLRAQYNIVVGDNGAVKLPQALVPGQTIVVKNMLTSPGYYFKIYPVVGEYIDNVLNTFVLLDVIGQSATFVCATTGHWFRI